uniref:Centrosomal protein of 162 kDa n=1 Tax=Macrostomum lignano TaxID=282301 RepID=A0A1I8INM2_9PLAT
LKNPLIKPYVPPSPANSHDHTVQQVALLKRELAEMRSRQALAETGRYSQTPTGLAGDLDKELGSTGLARIATTNAELQTERSTHAQAAASLEASERCYLSLVSALTGALRLTGPLPGQLPMSQAADVAERRRLTSERDKAAELIAERVRQMRERAERKDQLLEGYDGDLARLRQALQLAEARSAQVDALAEQLRARTEESELLRASLGQAKAATANGGGGGGGGATSAIVAKSRPRPAEAAPAADDSDGEEKEAARKRAIRERMKRKDYEIASLKAELRSREKDLRNASTKLSRLQTSLGLPHESELLGGEKSDTGSARCCTYDPSCMISEARGH